MFKNLEFLGSEKEISKIVNSTIGTLEREYKSSNGKLFYR